LQGQPSADSTIAAHTRSGYLCAAACMIPQMFDTTLNYSILPSERKRGKIGVDYGIRLLRKRTHKTPGHLLRSMHVRPGVLCWLLTIDVKMLSYDSHCRSLTVFVYCIKDTLLLQLQWLFRFPLSIVTIRCNLFLCAKCVSGEWLLCTYPTVRKLLCWSVTLCGLVRFTIWEGCSHLSRQSPLDHFCTVFSQVSQRADWSWDLRRIGTGSRSRNLAQSG